MYNYLLFRWLCFRNCDYETKADETILSKQITFATQNGKDKKQKGRLKCECFCNGHCAFECPNIEIDRFESWYDLPASDIGLSEVSCKNCQFYDKYMTCKDCLFQYDKECRFTNNFERGVK